MAILTVSRQYGSGGREIGRKAAGLMGYEFIDKERLLSDIRARGAKWEEWGKDMDEHCPSLWERFDWSFRGFAALIQSHLLKHALKDRVVIMGRGGNFLLKDFPHVLRIKVIAPAELRIETVMAKDSVDRETAKRLVEKIDMERECFIRIAYGGRWDDPKDYDMVFDTGVKTIEEILPDIREALIEKDRLITPEAVKALGMTALAAEIKAMIATNPDFFVPTLEVSWDGREVVLKGVIHNPEEHRHIEEAARRLAGDAPLRCELHYRV